MDATTLAAVMGHASGVNYSAMLKPFKRAAEIAEINTIRRMAMWCAQLGHESVGLKAMEEYASGAAYEGRQDLGNTRPGDGVRYKGRGPIQLTGRSNYRAFTNWARSRGYSTQDFEANPHLVATPEWGFLATAYYWVNHPTLNKYADQGDVLRASAVINGWYVLADGTLRTPNGYRDRLNRYNRAIQFGDRLMSSTPPVVYHPMRDEKYTTSSGYGTRWGSMHAGLDFAADHGTPIYAPTDGVVVQGADRPAGSVSGFGNWVWIDAQAQVGKDFIFGHMKHREIYVKRGDRVKAGQMIARVGSEGQSSGPHLHFEVWGPPGRTGGKHEDPAPWLAKNVNNGNIKTTNKEELTMADIEAIKAHITAEAEKTRKHITEFVAGYVAPVVSDTKDNRAQLTGGRDAGQYPGWPQLDHRTMVDALAAVGTQLEIPGFEDPHGGSLKAKREEEAQNEN